MIILKQKPVETVGWDSEAGMQMSSGFGLNSKSPSTMVDWFKFNVILHNSKPYNELI